MTTGTGSELPRKTLKRGRCTGSAPLQMHPRLHRQQCPTTPSIYGLRSQAREPGPMPQSARHVRRRPTAIAGRPWPRRWRPDRVSRGRGTADEPGDAGASAYRGLARRMSCLRFPRRYLSNRPSPGERRTESFGVLSSPAVQPVQIAEPGHSDCAPGTWRNVEDGLARRLPAKPCAVPLPTGDALRRCRSPLRSAR